MRFVTSLLTQAAALAVAAWMLDGIWFEGPTQGNAELSEKWLPLLIVALISGLVAAFVEPVVTFLSIPFIIVTLGLMLLVINALMLMLTAWIADKLNLGFHVDGFWNALFGSIIITIATFGIRLLLPFDE